MIITKMAWYYSWSGLLGERIK